MMRKLAFGLAVSVLAAGSASAAQRVSATPDDLSVQAMHNFASCVADTTPKGAAELLALDYRSPEYAKRVRRYSSGHADGRCLFGRMQFSQVLLAGGLAERLLIEKTKSQSLSRLVAYDPAGKPIVARSPMEMTSICVVRAEPAKVYNIFRTEPTSGDESHAMNAIAPALMNCVKAGQKMTLNKPGLRAALALAAYRLASQPEVYPAADGKPTEASTPQ